MLGLDKIFRPADFEGQKLAERVLIYIVIAVSVVGFIAGYVAGSFQLMVQINGAGLALVALAVLPPWPFYSRHPLKWLPELNPAKKG